MDFISILIIAIALSIDSLCASLSTGACMPAPNLKKYLKVAFFMAIFQGLMPVIGWIAGFGFKKYIQEADHWVAFGLLAAIGIKMIYEGIKNGNEKTCHCPTRTYILITLGLATSIDALIIGISFGIIDAPLLKSALIIGATTFIFSLVGVYAGNKIGKKVKITLEIPAGIVLILLGAKILFEHLGYMEKIF